MLLLALLNFAVGAGLGIRFGVMVLIPLTALAIIESVLFGYSTGSGWISALWQCVILIAALDVGYLVGLTIRDRINSARVSVLQQSDTPTSG